MYARGKKLIAVKENIFLILLDIDSSQAIPWLLQAQAIQPMGMAHRCGL